MTHNFRAVVSHPAKQGFLYQVPLALQREHIPVQLLTGIYYKPNEFPYSLTRWLPVHQRQRIVHQLEKRRIPELDPNAVTSLGGPWLEMVYRPFAQYWKWWNVHDQLASRWLSKWAVNQPVILHTFDGYVKRTLQVAKKRGWTSVLEVTSPLADEIFEQAFQRLGHPEAYTPRPAWQRNNLIQAYHAADYLIAQSWLTVRTLINLGVPKHRIILLPLGTDTNRFSPEPHDISVRPWRLVFVGRLSIQKGIDLLLEAWNQLALPNAELLLVGATVQNPVAHSVLAKYEGTFRHLGFVDNLPELLRSSDVFVLPSLLEGASMAMQEAMACGLPCIVSENVGCILRDGIDGFVVPVNDIHILKAKIWELYSNPKLASAMGHAARSRAEQFTWNKYGQRLVGAYENIFSNEQKSATDLIDMLSI